MTTIFITIAATLLYVISFLFTKKWISEAYRDGHLRHEGRPDMVAVLGVIAPGLNTIMMILFSFTNPKTGSNVKVRFGLKKLINKFFKLD